jgi:hypothetical protein
MRTITVRYGQTIFDIALQWFGDISGIAFIIEDNPSINLENELEAGTGINIRDAVINKTIVKEFEKFVPTSS